MDGLILAGILLLQGNALPAADSVQIDAVVALGGAISSRGFTEVHVRAYSATSGDLELQFGGGLTNTRTTLRLTAGEAAEWRMPVTIDPAQLPLTLDARVGGRVRDRLILDSVFHVRAPALLVGQAATQRLSGAGRAYPVDPASLPHFAPALRQVAALAIDGATLAALDDAQLRALLDFAGTCGRLLLIDASPAVAQIVSNRAACGGRFITTVATNTNVAVAFEELLAAEDNGAADSAQLNRLLASRHGPAVELASLGIFWSAFLLLYFFFAVRPRTHRVALGFGVLGTIIVWLAWPTPASRSYVAWAEVEAGARVARYAALERYSAPRRDRHTLPLASFGAAATLIRGDFAALDWHADNSPPTLVWDAAAFDSAYKWTTGSFTVDTRLRAAAASSGGIVVCNTAASESRPAWLRTGDETYAVPPLSPGTKWHSAGQDAADGRVNSTPPLRLFASRAAGYPISLLQSLPVAGGTEADRAWLMWFETVSSGEPVCGH